MAKKEDTNKNDTTLKAQFQAKNDPQKYDNTLKALFDTEAAEIIATLLGGAELLAEQNIEVDRTKLKLDLVYKVRRRGREAISSIELQTGADSDMERRMLEYHSILHAKYKLPVFSAVIYPFETSTPVPPYREMDEDTVILSLNYEVVRLWEQDAAYYVRGNIECMYTLLPAMGGATVPLLKYALKRISQRYTRAQLGHHLIRFHQIMLRSKTMTDEDKKAIEEELYMEYAFDEFIDNNPTVLEKILRGEKRGEERGEERGALLAFRKSILNTVDARFPVLVDEVKRYVEHINNLASLERLGKQLVIVPDETVARSLLQPGDEEK